MGNEPVPAFLKRKHKAEFNQEVNNELQARARRVPLCHSPAKADSSSLNAEKVNLNDYITTCYSYENGDISLINYTDDRKEYLPNINKQW